MEITITASYASLLPRIKRHLSVVGKRAHDINGRSMFSDMQTSSSEDPIFYDLLDQSAETLANHLDSLCKSYTPNMVGNTKTGVTFSLYSERWSGKDADSDISASLSEAIYNYLYNYAIAQYLSLIHPGTGEKYPPRWGTPYQEQCSVLISNIRAIAYNKRPPSSSPSDYSSISSEII